MKHLILIITIIVIVIMAISVNTYAADFYVFGFNWKKFKKSDFKKMAIGAVASVVVHEFGHFVALKATGTDWKITGPGTFRYYPESASDGKLIAQAGFIAQHGANLALTSFKKTKNTDFTKGYTLSTGLLHLTYPFRYGSNSGDINMIDKYGGDGMRDWAIGAGLVCHNIFRITWK